MPMLVVLGMAIVATTISSTLLGCARSGLSATTADASPKPRDKETAEGADGDVDRGDSFFLFDATVVEPGPTIGACATQLQLRPDPEAIVEPTLAAGPSTWAEISAQLPKGVSPGTLSTIGSQVFAGCIAGPADSRQGQDGAGESDFSVFQGWIVEGAAMPWLISLSRDAVVSVRGGDDGDVTVSGRQVEGAEPWWRDLTTAQTSAWIGTGGVAHFGYIARVALAEGTTAEQFLLGAHAPGSPCPVVQLLPKLDGHWIGPAPNGAPLGGTRTATLVPVVGRGLVMRSWALQKGKDGSAVLTTPILHAVDFEDAAWVFGPAADAGFVTELLQGWAEGEDIGLLARCVGADGSGPATLCRLRLAGAAATIVHLWPSAPAGLARYDPVADVLWATDANGQQLSRWLEDHWVKLPGVMSATMAARLDIAQSLGLSGTLDPVPDGPLSQPSIKRLWALEGGDVVLEIHRVLDFRGVAIERLASRVSKSGQVRWRRHLGLPVNQLLGLQTAQTMSILHGCRVSPLDAAGEPISPGADACTAAKLAACDDADPCTIDRCAAGSGCAHLALPAGTVCGLDPVRACNGSGACTTLLP